MQKQKFFRKALAAVTCMFVMASNMSLAFAAKAGEVDSHGNVVPPGREEVDSSAPRPLGWGNAPKDTAEAMKLGWSKRIPMRVASGGRAYFWVRETEVVPKGEKPLSTVHIHKLNTNVPGNTLGKDYGDAGTTVDVYAHRYIYADDDFTPPTAAHNPEAGDMMAPHRGLPPYSALPVPAYSFKDEELQKKYLTILKKAEIGTFWGSSAVVDKREGQVFYCINPNSLDPVANTSYFLINTKYDFQSNYRDLPELSYLLGTLMYNAKFYEENGSPNWDRGFDNLLVEFNRIVSNMDDLNSNEVGALDKRITLGELRSAMNTLMGKNGAVKFSGETMRVQNDPEPESGLKQLDGKISNSGAERKNDILVLGFEYPVGHYMQGMPIAEADKWFGRNGMWDFGNEGYQKARTVYGRAFARMLIAYTELARQKDLLRAKESPYLDIQMDKVSQGHENNKTVAKFMIKDVAAEGISGYTVVVPSELAEKVTITDPEDLLSTPSSGKYLFHPEQLKDGFTVKIDPSVSTEEVKKIKIVRHFKEKTVANAYSSKENYRYDEETKRWYIREMIVADVEGFANREPQRRHGMAYGQEIIQFSRSANERTASIALDLTRNAYGIKTTIGADTFSDDGTRTFKTASEKEALSAVYTPEQLKSGIQVKDTVAYKGLSKDKKYKLVAVLNELTDADKGTVKPITAKVGAEFSPDPSVAETDFAEKAKTEIDFGTLTNLEAGKTYVVYEYLFESDTKLATQDGASNIENADKEKAITTHENALDKGQTFKPTEKLSIKTVAYLGTDSAAPGTILKKEVTKQALAEGIEVSDRIEYTGLDQSKEYKFVAVLNTVDEQGHVTPVKATISQNVRPNDRKQALVRFGKLTNLKPNTNYVIYEYLFEASEKLSTTSDSTNITDEDKNKALASHADKDDLSQTFVLVDESAGELRTTVKAGEVAAGSDKEAVAQAGDVAVSDTVAYKRLEAGKEYVLKAELTENGSKVIKTVYHTFTPANAEGEETVDFGVVTLEAGKKYVVFESAIKTEDASKTEDGYFANDGKEWIEHKDPNDKAQTIVVEEPTGPSTESTTTTVTTTTTVPTEPTGETTTTTVPTEPTGETTTTTVLTEPTGETTTTTVPTEPTGETTTTTVPTEPTGETTTTTVPTEPTDGTTTTTTEPTGETTTTTVPTEPTDGTTATTTTPAGTTTTTQPTTSTTVPEERQPGIRTTVEIDGATANEAAKLEKTVSAEQLVAGIHVIDHVSYKGLDPAKAYKLVGVLHRVEKDGSLTPIALARSGNFTPNAAMSPNQYTAEAMEALDFGAVKGLEPGYDYVVYEYLFTSDVTLTTPDGEKDLGAEDKAKASEKHENPKDLSQTFVLKNEEETTTTTSTTVPSETTTVTEPTGSTTSATESGSSSTSEPTPPGGGGSKPNVPQTGEHDGNIALIAILLLSSVAVLGLRKKHAGQEE